MFIDPAALASPLNPYYMYDLVPIDVLHLPCYAVILLDISTIDFMFLCTPSMFIHTLVKTSSGKTNWYPADCWDFGFRVQLGIYNQRLAPRTTGTYLMYDFDGLAPVSIIINIVVVYIYPEHLPRNQRGDKQKTSRGGCTETHTSANT